MTKAFLIYSFDTRTTSYDLNGNEINLSQILGKGYGSTPIEALTNFLVNNNWINDFAFENIVVVEINDRNSIHTTLDKVNPIDTIKQ